MVQNLGLRIVLAGFSGFRAHPKIVVTGVKHRTFYPRYGWIYVGSHNLTVSAWGTIHRQICHRQSSVRDVFRSLPGFRVLNSDSACVFMRSAGEPETQDQSECF